MKKIYLVISFIFLSAYICEAQGGGGQLESLRIAFITRELNLNPAEAERFWPVFRSYNEELRQARTTYFNDQIAFEETVINIRKKYRPTFKTILVYDNRVNGVWIVDQHWREYLRQVIIQRQRRRIGP